MQTPQGVIKAKETLLKKDPDYFKKLGHVGGSKPNPNKGFASMTPEQRSKAGRKGYEARILNMRERERGNKKSKPNERQRTTE